MTKRKIQDTARYRASEARPGRQLNKCTAYLQPVKEIFIYSIIPITPQNNMFSLRSHTVNPKTCLIARFVYIVTSRTSRSTRTCIPMTDHAMRGFSQISFLYPQQLSAEIAQRLALSTSGLENRVRYPV